MPHFDYPGSGHVNCLHFLAIVKNAAMNVSVTNTHGLKSMLSDLLSANI